MAQLVEVDTVLTGYPGITREHVDGVSVGRAVITEQNIGIWAPNDTFLGFYNILNSRTERSATIRRGLVFSLNNNSPYRTEGVEHDRGFSAYFTYDPKGRAVILEWGMIDSTGNAKLHTYLNQVIDYRTRALKGMQLSSGHLARIAGTETYLAYLDRLSTGNEFAPNEPMAKMVNSLHSHGFIPLTAEGFVQIPYF